MKEFVTVADTEEEGEAVSDGVAQKLRPAVLDFVALPVTDWDSDTVPLTDCEGATGVCDTEAHPVTDSVTSQLEAVEEKLPVADTVPTGVPVTRPVLVAAKVLQALGVAVVLLVGSTVLVVEALGVTLGEEEIVTIEVIVADGEGVVVGVPYMVPVSVRLADLVKIGEKEAEGEGDEDLVRIDVELGVGVPDKLALLLGHTDTVAVTKLLLEIRGEEDMDGDGFGD